MSKPNLGPRLAVNASGYYEIRWVENGRSRRKSTRTSDPSRARECLAVFIQDQPGAALWSVNDVLSYYLRHHGAEVKDQKGLGISVRYLREHFGPLAVDSLDSSPSRAYAVARAEGKLGARPAKDGTIRRELGVLISALRFAHRDGKIRRAPFVPRPKAPAAEEKWLTQEQVEALIAHLQRCEMTDDGRPTPIHLFTVIGLCTGARKGAIEALKVKHVEVDGTKATLRFDLTTKSRSKKRRVAVPVNDFLRGYLPFLVEGDTEDPVLGSHGKVDSQFEWLMRRVASATGMNRFKDVTAHWLRHTCATQMLRNGADVWAVAGVLGDTVQTVTDTYGHHVPDHNKEAVDSWI